MMQSSSTPPLRWAHHIGLGIPQRFPREGIAVGGVGEVLLVGRHEGKVDLPALGDTVRVGPEGQLFGLMLGPEGDLRWYHGFATGEDRSPWTVAADRDGGWCLAGRAEDGAATVLKLSRWGARVWGGSLGNVSPARDHQPLAAAVDRNGYVFVFGHGCHPTSPAWASGASQYVYVAKLDPHGAVVWARRFACGAHATRPRLAIDAEGGVLASGAFRGSMTIGRETLSSGSWAAYAFHLDATGTPMWARRLGTGALAVCGVDAAGCVVARDIAKGRGSTVPWEIVLRAFAAGGALGWEQRYPCSSALRPETDVAITDGGSVLLGGTVAGELDLGATVVHGAAAQPRSFAARLDASGRTLWCQDFGSSDVIGLAVHGAPGGDVIVTASFRGRVDLGGGISNGGEHLDLVVARLAGEPLPEARGEAAPEEGSVPA